MELSDLLSDEVLTFCTGDGDAARKEADIDELFMKAFEMGVGSEALRPAQVMTTAGHVSSSPALLVPTSSSRNCKFAASKTDEDISRERLQGVPLKTQEDTKYCVSVWKEWCAHQAETYGDSIPALEDISISEFQHWLICFILEVRKRDGTEFTPQSLYHLCTGLQRFL